MYFPPLKSVFFIDPVKNDLNTMLFWVGNLHVVVPPNRT